MKSINELIEKRGEALEGMKAITALAETENRDLNADEQARYDVADADQMAFKARADRMLNEETESAELAAAYGRDPVKGSIILEPTDGAIVMPHDTPEYVSAFLARIRTGPVQNALSVGTDAKGGYLVPTELDKRIRERRDDWNDFRSKVEVIVTSSDTDLPVESSIGASTWVAEAGSFTESDDAFGAVTMNAYKLGRIVKLSEELAADSAFDIFAWLAKTFGRSHGMAEELSFVNNAVAGRPQGLIQGGTAITTLETGLTEDFLYDMYYGLARPYRKNAEWVFHDTSAKVIRKIEDDDGHKIWQPSMQAGEPDRLLSHPFTASTAMNEITDSPNVPVAVFADMESYTVADRQGHRVQVLLEKYADTGQIGYRGWLRTDGKVTLAEGVAVGTLA